MIVAISYHQGDQQLMTRWANRVKQLGPYYGHQIILLPAHGASSEGIIEVLKDCFSKVDVLPCYHTERGWPISCNMAFEQAAWHSFNVTKQPFLWMEPDAAPLCVGWIDKIEEEYQSSGKPFMGDFVGIAGVMPNGVDHMSGIAVYHWNMPALAPSAFRNERTAWDIMSAKDVIPKMHRTGLIQHDWVPTKQWRRDAVDSSCVRPGAVIYHPDKKGVLFGDSESLPYGVQGDPATGEQSSPHETKVNSDEEKQEIQYETTAQESEAFILERFNETLARCAISRSIKRKVRESLINHGWLKAPQKGKRTRKKVSSPVGDV